MIAIATLLCALAVFAQGIANPASPRLHLGEPHISGGRFIPIRVAPYQVSIQTEGKHYCGGSIISRYHVLTSGHCILDESEGKKVVIRSRTHLWNSKGNTHQVVQSFRHNLYNMSTEDYDVGIFKVAEPFTVIFNNRRPAKIVDAGELTPDNSTVVATGWGADMIGGDFSDKLKAVELVYMNHDHCAKIYAHDIFNVTPRMICAVAPDHTSDNDVCQGDVGGPLVSKETGKQVGIISFGFGCGRTPEFPAIYVNLADQEIHDFISETLKN